MLSQKTVYLLRAMIHLADHFGGEPVPLIQIAEAQNIPPKFLTVIMSQMSRLGYVTSKRGRDGGYVLARPPSQISYGELIRVTRGALSLVPCASRYGYVPCTNCITQETCRVHHAMLMVRDVTARVLDGLTLADKIDESGGFAMLAGQKVPEDLPASAG